MNGPDFTLPRGVTGFWRRADGRPPVTCAKDFQAACRGVWGQGVTLVGFEVHLEGVVRNYHQALFRQRDGVLVQVLCNAHHPFVCFAEGEPDLAGPGPLPAFLDPPVWAEGAFAEYVVLNRSILTRRLARRADPHLSELGRGEVEQVHSWKPERLGEVLFNCWD